MYMCQENVHSIPENQKFVFREVSVPAWFGVCFFGSWRRIVGVLGERMGGRRIVGFFSLYLSAHTSCRPQHQHKSLGEIRYLGF